MTDALRVCVELDGRPIEAGIAYFTHRGTLTTSFRYSRDYLRRPGAYESIRRCRCTRDNTTGFSAARPDGC